MKGRKDIGTNFYLYFHRSDVKLGRGKHIGKNSCGWVFHFEADNKLKTVEAMKEFTKTGYIYDEYGREIPYNEFWDIVESSKEPFNGRPPYILVDPDYPNDTCSDSWEDEGFAFTQSNFS